MQTQVMVPDGGTTVVGGALLDSEREEQNRTPGLSKVPLLGNLFKRKGVFRDSQEILFFITPRVYRPDFEGNPTSSKRGNGTNSTTLIQPVPLGNPSSNSETVPVVPVNQAPVVPAIVQTQANPAASSKP
jgi:type II secretory pathway component GspD/PulD (secretin)